MPTSCRATFELVVFLRAFSGVAGPWSLVHGPRGGPDRRRFALSAATAPRWFPCAAFLAGLAALTGAAAQPPALAAERGALQWQTFPDAAKFRVLGLHWVEENAPHLWRLPAQAMGAMPKGVQGRAKCPSGARIVFRSTASRLAVRAAAVSGGNLARLEAWVNGVAQRPAPARKEGADTEVLVYDGGDSAEKEFVIYLPHLQEVTVKAIGTDEAARFSPLPPRFAESRPVVFYGSSVCQGSAAQSPAQTYPAIVSRQLNLDFVNLGFGGAGKAEPEVVRHVTSLPGCAYVFDLGKSYGSQDSSAFMAMLQTIRRDHPQAPIIVVTPITSAKEVREADYSAQSLHTRKVMRDPARELIRAGDPRIVVVEGEDLLGFQEHHLLSRDGVHPSDEGYRVIAVRLAPVLRQALAPTTPTSSRVQSARQGGNQHP
ncbi:MAG: hypothetical protein FJ399_04905 [Verrucomicrobia bacterium]|nr:hypothetical protein [Verrucomicrobiota bacterium]